MSAKRPGMSDDERALIGRHRRSQPKRPEPEFIDEECTGKYTGPELAERRAKRPTEERIKRLEDKHDVLVGVVTETRVDVGTMTGKLDAFLDAIQQERTAAHQTEQVRIGSRAKVIVAIVGAIGLALGALITAMAGCS